MRFVFRLMAFAGMSLLLTTTAEANGGVVPAPPTVLGRWASANGTLTVGTPPCAADRLCGAVVRASPVAAAYACDAGLTDLDGKQMLQDHRPAAPGTCSRIYVTDMVRSFSSHIRYTSPDTLAIPGCLTGGLSREKHVWHPIS